jgi:hypothetical protein
VRALGPDGVVRWVRDGLVHWVTGEACGGVMSWNVVSLLPGELPQCSAEGVELRPASAPFDDLEGAFALVRALGVVRDVIES